MNLIRKNKSLKQYVLLITIIAAIYIIINKLNIENNIVLIQRIMLSSIFCTMFIFSLKYNKNKFESQDFINCVIIMGCIMRIGYMIYTPCNIRGHDVWEISADSYGHAAYLLNIIERHMLPNTNEIQFYQQPFFYLCGSIVSIIVNGILGRTDSFYFADAAKIVSCFASCEILFVCGELFEEIEMKEASKKIAVIIAAFLPNFYLMGGRINCDALAAFFMAIAILYTVKYNKEQSWENIISLAFIYGFALMTKISCGLIAVFTAVIMIKHIYFHYRNNNLKQMILKLSVFSIISFPLGLWYSIRNYILFKQKFTYVLPLDVNSDIYCGNHSIFSRFIVVSFKNLFKTPYAKPMDDYNYPAYLIKTMTFGEFDLKKQGLIPIMLLLLVMILAFLCIIAALYAYFEYKDNKMVSIGFFVLFAGIYLSSIRFNMSYPFGCSMDFRYIAVMAVLGSIFIGNMYSALKEKQTADNFLKVINQYGAGLSGIIKVIVILYSIFSILMYVTLP